MKNFLVKLQKINLLVPTACGNFLLKNKNLSDGFLDCYEYFSKPFIKKNIYIYGDLDERFLTYSELVSGFNQFLKNIFLNIFNDCSLFGWGAFSESELKKYLTYRFENISSVKNIFYEKKVKKYFQKYNSFAVENQNFKKLCDLSLLENRDLYNQIFNEVNVAVEKINNRFCLPTADEIMSKSVRFPLCIDLENLGCGFKLNLIFKYV